MNLKVKRNDEEIVLLELTGTLKALGKTSLYKIKTLTGITYKDLLLTAIKYKDKFNLDVTDGMVVVASLK